MQTEKVHFIKEKETMLVTLYGRALETDEKDPILSDPAAKEAVSRIDYDFQGLNVKWNDRLAIAARAKVFDEWVEEFLADNPKAVVLHLGCGLDSRIYRVNPPSDVLWFDVDYPEIIELRQRLYPEREGYQMIGSSVTDTSWLKPIPGDHPALVVAEGLMYYLKEDEVKSLVKRIVERFPSGQIMFDATSKLYLKFQKTNVGISATGSRIWWGIDDAYEIEEWSPKIKLLTNWSVMSQDFPSIQRMPKAIRLVLRVIYHIRALREMGLMLKYEF